MVAAQNATAQFRVAGRVFVDKTTYVLSHLKEIPIPFKQDFKNAKVAYISMQVYGKQGLSLIQF